MRNAKKLLALVLAFVMVLGVLPTASAQTVHTHGIEEYPEIQLNVETTVVIDDPGETVYFRFTPTVTAEYTFASHDTEWNDPQGYLYDSELNLIAYHEDIGFNPSLGYFDVNFTLTHELEAGVTYVWAVNLYNGNYVGEFPVTLTGDLPAEHNYVGEVTTEPTCTTDGVMTYTCTDCGDSYTETIPAGHDYVDGICSRCGEEYAITGECGEDLTWVLNGVGVLTISGTGDMYDYNLHFEPMIPWADYLQDIESVVVEEGATSVGNFAFMNAANLTSVTLPDSLTSIGESAFRNCGALTTVDFSANLNEIKGFAFMNCYALTAADLGNKIETIGNSAFYSCNALAEVNLGESLIAIDTLAFSCCTSLTEVTMPDTVEGLGSDVFNACTSLETIKLSNNLTDLPAYTFNECFSLVNVTMPQYLSTIGTRGFYRCESLETIDLPFSLIAIGDDAFGFCTSLTDLQLPMALSYVGYFAFNGCTGLTAIEFPPNLTYFTGGCFYDCTGLTEIIFPEGTFYVDDDAFAGCTNVKKIVFTGILPTILNAFIGVDADAWYPAGDDSWTSDALLNYGGSLTWHAMCAEHDFGKWTPIVEATCTESGIEEHTCLTCAWNEQRVSEPKGHIWDEGVAQGEQTLYTCLICGETRLDNHVHAYEAVVTDPSCTEGGYTTYVCECGDSYTADETAALGHDWKGVNCTRCEATRENPFTDVPNDSFCIDPVLWAVENNITDGTSATTFDPNGKCARAIVVTFLWRAAGCPEPETTVNRFTDVEEGAFYYKAVLWAVEEGITNGVSADKFAPATLCNRAEVVTFLYRAMGEPEVNTTENPFTDVDNAGWYAPAVLWAVENNITSGISKTEFAPGNLCTRAEVVTFLYRAKA